MVVFNVNLRGFNRHTSNLSIFSFFLFKGDQCTEFISVSHPTQPRLVIPTYTVELLSWEASRRIAKYQLIKKWRESKPLHILQITKLKEKKKWTKMVHFRNMVLKTKRNVAEVHADNDDEDENKCCLCMDTIKVRTEKWIQLLVQLTK